MAKHQFGILPQAPNHGERYDEYKPQNCSRLIAVDDEHIEPLLEPLSKVELYCHSVDKKVTGLVYCGITLIPPQAMEQILSVIRDEGWAEELREMLQQAKGSNKFIIHYGL